METVTHLTVSDITQVLIQQVTPTNSGNLDVVADLAEADVASFQALGGLPERMDTLILPYKGVEKKFYVVRRCFNLPKSLLTIMVIDPDETSTTGYSIR